MGEIAHAILGASSASRWLNCPGSVRLTKDLPDQSSPYAALGSAAHELCDICLNDGSDAASHTGEHITAKGEEFEVDAEMASAVQIYLDYVREILDD